MKFYNTCVQTLALMVFMLFTGCASIISKSDYSVIINSQPNKAKFSIIDNEGMIIFSGRTPSTIILSAGSGFWKGAKYTVKFEKDGYVSEEIKIKRGIDGWYIIGNFGFGGLIGWLIVDPATGAMWTLEKNVYGNLTPKTSSLDGSTSDLKLLSLHDIPNSLRKNLVPIDK